MSESWTIKVEGYGEWGNKAKTSPSQIDLLSPSVRNLVYLALLDKQGQECSYDDLHQTIYRSGSIEGSIPKDNLRVAVLDLRAKLADSQFDLRSDRRGREAVLQLTERN